MDAKPRIAPAWLVALLTLAVLAALYAVAPRGGMRERIASIGAPSGLSVAYLEAWSRVQPDNEEFLALLAAQYAYLGMPDDMERIAKRMDALGTPDMHRASMTARISIAARRTFALAESDPGRAAALDDLRARIAAAAAYEWSARDLQWLAEQAAASGVPRLAMSFYTRLSEGDPRGRQQWDTNVARYALQVGDYRAAAAAWFRQEDAAKTLDERRRCFLAGIRVLRSGNLMDEAVTAADAHLGALADDPSTLVELVNLARAANRPDAVDRYAKMLARYAQLQPQVDPATRFGDGAVSARAAYAYRDGPLPMYRWAAAQRIETVAASARGTDGYRVIRVGTDAARAASLDHASDANIADTVYRAFVEAGDTANAERVAKRQVERDAHSTIWTQRLAQVAQWNNDPSVALQAWLSYAQLSNDPQAWKHVLRMAPMLDDDNAYLIAVVREARAAPDDLKKVDSATATYERLGRPDDALAFLHSLPAGKNGDALETRIGQLAERAGYDDQALAAYRKVQARHPGDVEAALRTASVLYRQGHQRASFEALEAARAGARDSDADYWRDYGELARLLGRDADANEAYRHVLAGGDPTPEELGEMTYFYDPYPIDAGRVAELRFQRDHSMLALQNAIYYYTSARAMDRVAALVDRLTPADRSAALASPGVLEARAEHYRLTGRPLDALADLRAAVGLPGAGNDLRAAYLWMLVDYGTDAELAEAMRRSQDKSARSAAMWGPLAAAAMRLNRPIVALEYLRREAASSSRDPLWLLAYADAQEMAGHADLAWSVRRKVWLSLRDDDSVKAATQRTAGRSIRRRAGGDAETLDELRGRRVALSADFTTGDASAALLADLLSDKTAASDARFARRSLLASAAGLPGAEPQSGIDAEQNTRLRNAAAKDVAIAWAVSREANPLAKRWLAQQYAAHLLRPADSRLTIALAEDDRPTMERLIANERSRLPIYDRIDAMVATDQPARAERLAFAGLDGAPEDDGVHTRLVDTALAWPQSIDASVTNYVEHPLDYVEQTLGASRKIAEHYMIGLTGVQHFQRSTDEGQLVNVPSVDRWINAYVRRQTADSSFTMTAGRREALDSFYTFELAAEAGGRNGPITVGLRAGRNQVADESQALQVGGMKDHLTGEFTWRMTQRLSFTGSIQADRFYSQARNYLGSGMLSTGELIYQIRTEYPDYAVRLVGIRGDYSASGTADVLISRLVPAANLPATAADFIPATYAQYGLYFSFGTELLTQYTHRWRPFLDVGIVHDSNQGWGPDFQIGLAGSIFGGDHAALYFQHLAVSRQGVPVTEIGARYSWFY